MDGGSEGGGGFGPWGGGDPPSIFFVLMRAWGGIVRIVHHLPTHAESPGCTHQLLGATRGGQRKNGGKLHMQISGHLQDIDGVVHLFSLLGLMRPIQFQYST